MLNAGFKQVGAVFPVFIDELGEEHALARVERKICAGYHGFSLNFDTGVSLEDDLKRRDFSINSMAQDADGNIIDPFGGQADLASRVLRPVSDAFGEDPVRVIRAFRFLSRFGPEWSVSPLVDEWCKSMIENGEFLALPRERFLLEVEKVLTEPHWHLFFNSSTIRDVFLHRFGVSLPDVNAGNPFLELGKFTETIQLLHALGASSDMRVKFDVAHCVVNLDRNDEPTSALFFEKLLSRVSRNKNLLNLVSEFDKNLENSLKSAFELKFAHFDSEGANPMLVRMALEDARFDRAFNQWLKDEKL
jgi:tRNA nucleotidyltransferase/poly(A) polymerase